MVFDKAHDSQVMVHVGRLHVSVIWTQGLIIEPADWWKLPPRGLLPAVQLARVLLFPNRTDEACKQAPHETLLQTCQHGPRAQARSPRSWRTSTSWSASRCGCTPPRPRPRLTTCCRCCSAWTSASRARPLGPEPVLRHAARCRQRSGLKPDFHATKAYLFGSARMYQRLAGYPTLAYPTLSYLSPAGRGARRYVSSNPQYADSAAYAGRYRALQARALASLRSRVQTVLRHAAEQARASASLSSP